MTRKRSPAHERMLLVSLAVGYSLLVTLGPVKAAFQGRLGKNWPAICAMLLLFTLPGVAMCFRRRWGYFIVIAVAVFQLVGSFVGACLMLFLVLMKWLSPNNVSVDMSGLESWSPAALLLYNSLLSGVYVFLAYALLRKDTRALFRLYGRG